MAHWANYELVELILVHPQAFYVHPVAFKRVCETTESIQKGF